MAKDQKEWFKQADYDMGAAQAMFDSGRYIYTVFMCHLSIEKALKGHYFKKFNNHAPKTHNLGYLSEKIGFEFPKNIEEFIMKLNRESVVTRYPEDIMRMDRDYSEKKAKETIKQSREVLEWLRERL